MNKLSFAQMRDTEINIIDVAAVERDWKANNINRYPDGRDVNILSATLNGLKAIYTSEDSAPLCTLTSPSVVLIAQGAPYFSHTAAYGNSEQSTTLCVKFRLTDRFGQELRLNEQYLFWESAQAENCIPLFRRVLSDYLCPNINRLRLKTDLLQLFDELITHMPQPDTLPEEFRFLQPAVRHIEQDPCDNMPISDLARMCFISESYFRASFKRFTGGLSATEYRNRLRIAKAQELIDSSLWTTALIAEKLGFYDVSHFYRVYKKVNGTLPKRT